MNRRNSATAVVIVALAALAAALALYVTRTEKPTASLSPAVAVQTATPTPTTPASPLTERPAATPGRSYHRQVPNGSDFIPPVTVFAISTTDPRVWYAVVFTGFGSPPRPTPPPGVLQPTYTITGVAPGTYWVVAYRDDGQLPDPGYYSRRVDCLRTTPSGPCPDASLVPATVIAGQTTTGIDVISWGPPNPAAPSSPTFPPRPTPR